jgi:hypothetical protein
VHFAKPLPFRVVSWQFPSFFDGETQDRQKKPLSNLPQKLAFLGEILEAPIRIELMHKGFADLSLTTWARRHVQEQVYHASEALATGKVQFLTSSPFGIGLA